MSIQPLLPFEDVPITCPTQAKYHAIAPCLVGQIETKQQAQLLNGAFSVICVNAILQFLFYPLNLCAVASLAKIGIGK